MFERYTEKARRVIFFGRYEASQLGSEYIEPEHLLLGMLRDDKALFSRLLPQMTHAAIEAEVRQVAIIREVISTNVDLPLSERSKRVLLSAAREADELNHRHIGSEHLLLGLLHEQGQPVSELLRKYGAKFEDLRRKIAENPAWHQQPIYERLLPRRFGSRRETIKIHDLHWNMEYIREAVRRCREHSWHWQKQTWKPRDIVVDRQTGLISFDLTLAADATSFELVKNGWKKDHCAVCRWELYESADDPTHGTGYSNGREWVCTECYERFIQGPGFFSSSYSDVT